MRSYGDDEIQVAVGRAAHARTALAGDANPRAVGDTSRNLHLEPSELAVCALHLQHALRAGERLLQRHVDRLLVVLASLRHPPAAKACTRTGPAEQVAEQVAERRVVKVRGLETHAALARAPAGAAKPRLAGGCLGCLGVLPIVPIAIVLLALLGIGENLVRLADLLELASASLSARIQVRMILPGEAAIGLPDLFLTGALGYAQHLVIVLFGRRHSDPPCGRERARARLLNTN